MTYKGPQEDKLFTRFPSHQKNMRRGNTLLEIENLESKDVKVKWLRRGLCKFYDMKLDYINNLKLQVNQTSDINLKLYTMGPVFNFLKNQDNKEQQNSVQIIRTSKANGENIQISYSQDLQAWIIASKNVCIAARNIDDLHYYKDYRFQYATLMGLYWLKFIQNYREIQLEELKKDLQYKTLIGEYVSNKGYQHIIKYDQCGILFYSIVDLTQEDQLCVNPFDAQEFFKKYGLQSVKIQDEGSFDNYSDLCSKLLLIHKEIAEASITDEEEGSVIYLIGNDSNLNSKVLSLSKLKTNEYRIFRKLREKLKHFVEDEQKIWGKQEQTQIKFKPKTDEYLGKLTQFKNEIISFGNGYKLPHDIKLYQLIGDIAFDQICQRNDNGQLSDQANTLRNLLNARFVDFILEMIEVLKHKIQLRQVNEYKINFDQHYFTSKAFQSAIQTDQKIYGILQEEEKTTHNQEIQDDQKLPLYIGLLFENKSEEKIKVYLRENLEFLNKQLLEKNDTGTKSQIEEQLSNLLDNDSQNNQMSYAKDFHLTTLYFGDSREVKSLNPIFTEQFKEFTQIRVRLSAIVYVPNKIAVGVAFIQDDCIKSENKFTHVTLMCGEWTPNMSNIVLEALFNRRRGKARELYSQLTEEGIHESQVQEFAVEINRKQETVFVISFFDHLDIEGEMRKFY
eukprot:403366623